MPIPPKNKQEEIASQFIRLLKDEYVVVGKGRIPFWKMGLLLGVCLGIIIAFSFLASRSGDLQQSQAATAGSPIGSHDENTPSAVRGWACDPDNPNAQLTMHFYRDGEAGRGGVYIGQAVANRPREAGVGQACNSHSNHGFTWNIPGALWGQPHTIYVYALNTAGTSGDNVLLPASSRSVTPMSQIRLLYRQPVITDYYDIKSRILWHPVNFTQAKNKTYFILWQQTNTSKSISWNVSGYTGFAPPPPVSSYQFGVNNSLIGSTSVQVNGNTVGFLNAPQTVARTGYPVIPMVMNHQFDYANPKTDFRPWSRPTSELEISAEIQVPTSNTAGGAVNYVQPVISIVDRTKSTPTWFYIVVGAYDSRGASVFADTVVINGDGYGIPVIGSFYGSTSGYMHKASASSESVGTPWTGYKTFRIRMSRGELMQAITDLRARHQDPQYKALSMRPEDYSLGDVSIMSEIFYPASAPNAYMGTSFRNVYLAERW